MSVNSTFQAYGTDIKVVGIFDTGTTFQNNTVVMPLGSLQQLSAQPGAISTIYAQVDSITNVDAAKTTIQDKLGATKVDVVSEQDRAANALTPLENIKTISLYSLLISLSAGAIIIFLTMLMIVRERRREIGVLKAIGADDTTIVPQFIVESLTFTLIATIVAAVISFFASNPILSALVTSSAGQGGRGGGFRGGFGGGFGGARAALQSIRAVVDWHLLLYGLGVAVAIAIVGSAIPAWLIARIRPAEVLRGE